MPIFIQLNSRDTIIKWTRYILYLVFIGSAMPNKLLAAQTSALETLSDTDGGSSTYFILWFFLGLVIASALLVTALTKWGHKQDNINNMMSFCIKYLVETRNEEEKCGAAQALGHVNDPGALLILVDVINDESAAVNLRKTARDALKEMSGVYRKYQKLINDLLSSEEAKDHQRSIDILISNFERRDKTYVQSAFVIGREFIRLKKFADARGWLQIAKIRNKKTVVYVHQISELIDLCNQKLFFEGDALFKAGDYYQALERYALASHDLDYIQKRRYVCHLRLACVYCKLTHYDDAYQETLHALRDNHATDISLKLNNLLKRQKDQYRDATQEQCKLTLDQIDQYVTKTLEKLSAESLLDAQ